MRAEVFEGLAGLAHCEADWRRLHALLQVPAYHLEFAVVRAVLTWLDAAPDRQLFVRVTDGGSCVAVLRLAPCDRTLFRVLRVRALETTTYAECRHQDVLIQPGIDIRAVWAALTRAMAARRQRWDALTSIATPDGGGFQQLARAMPERGRIVGGMVGFERAHRFDASLPHATLAARFSPVLTKNLAKGWRRMARSGAWEVLSLCGAADTHWAFDDFCRIEASGWKGAQGTGTATSLSGPASAYCRELFLLDEAGCRGEVNLLRLDGRTIAAQFCLISGRARFVLKIGFDEAHSRLGPGQLLMDEMLRRSCADPGIVELNVVSNQPWHRDWHPDSTPVHDYMLLRNRALALGWQLFSRLRSALRPSA